VDGMRRHKEKQDTVIRILLFPSIFECPAKASSS
jgi:hypothetical protein